MNKRGIALFVILLVILMPTVEAFSFQDIFDAIGNFFKSIFGKETIGIPKATEPTYTIEANPESGTAPLTVSFIVTPNEIPEPPGPGLPPLNPMSPNPTGAAAVSQAGETTYDWNFGDGNAQTTTTNTVEHIYSREGSFEASVIIKQDGEIIGYSDVIVITVNAPQPTYSLTASPQSGTVPLDVSFTVTQIMAPNPTGEALVEPTTTQIVYEWNFGDNNIETTTTTTNTHTYQSEGNYQAKVTVKQDGEIIGFSNEVTISVESAANINIEPESLDFGQVEIGSSLSKNIEITNIGETTWYVDKIIIQDPEITVSDETFTLYPDSMYTLTVTFTPISTGVVEGYFTVYATPNKRLFDYYYSGGTPYILTANPESGYAPLSVFFSVTQDTTITNATTNMTSQATGAAVDSLDEISYEWNFGDNIIQTTTSNTFSYVYENEGSYDAYVRIKQDGDEIGVSNNVTITVNAPLDYGLIANPTFGYAPLTVSFSLSGDPPLNTNFMWFFGDETVTNTQMSMSHTYTDIGEYDVYVKIIEPEGPPSFSNHVEINVESQPSGPSGNGGGGGGDGGGGSGGGISGCTPQWSCTLWSSCSSEGTQTRTCSDFNNCGTSLNKPSEIQLCTPTLADQLGISSIGENIGGEIQDFISEGELTSTHIALILLFILIILSSLFIYFRGPFRKRNIIKKPEVKKVEPIKESVIDSTIKPAIDAIKKARIDGFTREEIEIELKNKGWTEEQIKDILKHVF